MSYDFKWDEYETKKEPRKPRFSRVLSKVIEDSLYYSLIGILGLVVSYVTIIFLLNSILARFFTLLILNYICFIYILAKVKYKKVLKRSILNEIGRGS